MKKSDKYGKIARKLGYRSRTAIKLKQINEKFNLIKKNTNVLDLGCVPGGTLKYFQEHTKGEIVGVDIREIKPIKKIKFIKKSVFKLDIKDKFDLIFSDMGPIPKNEQIMDLNKLFKLVNEAIKITNKNLKKNGNFVCKVFMDKRLKEILQKLKQFEKIEIFKPEASRNNSKETYIIALNKNFEIL